jgi:uncharacterized protein with GYD domain
MAKYLFKASYTTAGLNGLKKEGAANRSAAVDKMCRSVGGSLDSFHFAFGDVDVFATCDLPDDETAAALAFTIGASGAVDLETVKLLTVEQADAAFARTVDYTPPGG